MRSGYYCAISWGERTVSSPLGQVERLTILCRDHQYWPFHKSNGVVFCLREDDIFGPETKSRFDSSAI